MYPNLNRKNISVVRADSPHHILSPHNDSANHTEVCREIGISKATVSALIKKLREKGYLYFLADPEDVRKKKVLPTAKLMAEGKEFIQKAERMESEICSVFDRKEQVQLWNLERKLIRQLAGMERSENSEENRQEVYQP